MLTISSGPRLMADRTEFEKSLVDLPGEGRTYSSKEEGTKIWKNKTLRKYHEPVPKEHRPRVKHSEVPAIDYRSDRSDISDGFRSLYRNHRAISATDDQKLVTADDLDKIFLEKDPKGFLELQNSESYSYIPTVRDVAIQCNRKKSNRHLLDTSSVSNDSGVRVIRSTNDGFVSAYSDVPQLKTKLNRTPVSKHEVWDERDSQSSEAIYSKVDKSKKKSVKRDIVDDFDPNDSYPTVIYRTPVNERRSPSGLSHHSRYSGSEYSTHTNRTLKNKTKGIGFTLKSGVDGPKVDLPPTSPKLRSRSLGRTRYDEPQPRWDSSLTRGQTKREVKQEVLEETISISNASSDDLDSYRGQDRSFDHFIDPKPQFREIERKRKDLSYVNESANRVKDRDGSGDRSTDYRRPNAISYRTPSETSYSTLSRFDSKKKDFEPIEFSPPPRQAYTLDRRHMKDKQKVEKTLPLKTSPAIGSRLYKSTADLTEKSRYEDLRGGLANAYKNRQENRQEKRTSSLNRMSAIREGRVSPSPSAPVRYLSHSHLNSAGNSLNSSSESDTIHRHRRQYIHDREPIVMYIPAVSHHNKKAEDEPDRLSGILRPNSRTGSTASSKKQSKKPPKSSASDISPSKTRDYSSKYSDYGGHRPRNDEERDQIVELRDTKNFGKLKKGKSILSRRHSIPKDTKFPWLQKLKSKVKFKE